MELSGDSALTDSKQGFLASSEKRSVPNRLVVMVVGWGPPRLVGQSGYSDGSVEVEDDGEGLDVEEDLHVGKGPGRRSIHAIESPKFPGERSWP